MDISNKGKGARGGQLIQLEPGKHTKAAVVTGVVAVALPPAHSGTMYSYFEELGL